MIRPIIFVVTLFLLTGCANFPSVTLGRHCDYTQRDLTVGWSDRLYWCER